MIIWGAPFIGCHYGFLIQAGLSIIDTIGVTEELQDFITATGIQNDGKILSPAPIARWTER